MSRVAPVLVGVGARRMLAVLLLCGAGPTPKGLYEYTMRWPVRQYVRVRAAPPCAFSLYLDGVVRLPETPLEVNTDEGWAPVIPDEVQAALRKFKCSLIDFEYRPEADAAHVRFRAPLLGERTLVLKHVDRARARSA